MRIKTLNIYNKSNARSKLKRIKPSYALFLITIIYALNVLDRFILSILLPQIKADLLLTDTQLGLLTGVAFAIFYATLGIPIARLADKFSRKKIIAVSLAVFSFMTTMCGLAKSFTSLLIFRAGVAIGEAGTSPPSFSIISDLYPPHKRATAMAIFTLGSNLGLLLGFIIGGFIAAKYGWQLAFFVVGVPGLVVAVLTWCTLREPARGAADLNTEKQNLILEELTPPPSFITTVKTLLLRPSYIHIVIANSLTLIVTNGLLTWVPSFMNRTHGMESDKIGLILGLVYGLGGIVGTLFIGGFLADKLSHRDIRFPAWIASTGLGVIAIFQIVMLTANDQFWLLSSLTAISIMGAFFQGPTLAMVQGIAPIKMRATAGALLLFFGNLIGLGVGPLLIGSLSDYLMQLGNTTDSLRMALFVLPPIALWASCHYAIASRTLKSDYRLAKSDSQ